jgi:hypothetical protein
MLYKQKPWNKDLLHAGFGMAEESLVLARIRQGKYFYHECKRI